MRVGSGDREIGRSGEQRVGKPGRYGCCLLLSAYCLLLLASACAPGPKYVKPAVATPPAYKELAPSAAGPQGEWKASQPQDQVIRGKWWEIFNDPQLNSLEERVDVSNQNLKIAEAQFRQARDLIRINRSGLYPTVSAGPYINAEQFSKNAPNAGALIWPNARGFRVALRPFLRGGCLGAHPSHGTSRHGQRPGQRGGFGNRPAEYSRGIGGRLLYAAGTGRAEAVAGLHRDRLPESVGFHHQSLQRRAGSQSGGGASGDAA